MRPFHSLDLDSHLLILAVQIRELPCPGSSSRQTDRCHGPGSVEGSRKGQRWGGNGAAPKATMPLGWFRGPHRAGEDRGHGQERRGWVQSLFPHAPNSPVLRPEWRKRQALLNFFTSGDSLVPLDCQRPGTATLRPWRPPGESAQRGETPSPIPSAPGGGARIGTCLLPSRRSRRPCTWGSPQRLRNSPKATELVSGGDRILTRSRQPGKRGTGESPPPLTSPLFPPLDGRHSGCNKHLK